MKTRKKYKVIIEIDEDGYFIGRIPALPGCYTQAKNLIEFKKRVHEAIKLCLEVAETDPDYKKRIKEYSYEPSFVGLELITI